MLLKKTKEGSQFFSFHISSDTARSILGRKTPMLNDKYINILQVAYINDEDYNMIIEFEYIFK